MGCCGVKALFAVAMVATWPPFRNLTVRARLSIGPLTYWKTIGLG
jgi:hypothetical protein